MHFYINKLRTKKEGYKKRIPDIRGLNEKMKSNKSKKRMCKKILI